LVDCYCLQYLHFEVRSGLEHCHCSVLSSSAFCLFVCLSLKKITDTANEREKNCSNEEIKSPQSQCGGVKRV
jgi:hypothetical protein